MPTSPEESVTSDLEMAKNDIDETPITTLSYLSSRLSQTSSLGQQSHITAQEQFNFVRTTASRPTSRERAASAARPSRQPCGTVLTAEGGSWSPEFTEVESGKRSDRPQLAEARAACRRRKATLVIAKLDWLARNVHSSAA